MIFSLDQTNVFHVPREMARPAIIPEKDMDHINYLDWNPMEKSVTCIQRWNSTKCSLPPDHWQRNLKRYCKTSEGVDGAVIGQGCVPFDHLCANWERGKGHTWDIEFLTDPKHVSLCQDHDFWRERSAERFPCTGNTPGFNKLDGQFRPGLRKEDLTEICA